MTDSEAIAICREWFTYLERQEAKTKRLQELAALAKTGPEGHKQAQRELKQIDKQPVVYDGARLLPAVKYLVERIRSQGEGNE